MQAKTVVESVQSIDASVLEGLRELGRKTGRDILSSVLKSYLGSTPGLLETVRQAVEDDDPRSLASAAHRLKSSSASVGAPILAELSEQLEARGNDGDAKDAEALVASLFAEYEIVAKELRAIRRRSTPASRAR